MSLLDLFKKKGSGDVAKDRLKLLLVSDRANQIRIIVVENLCLKNIN